MPQEAIVMTNPISEKLIQRQINHWNRYREFLVDAEERDTAPPGPVITVSRLAGSGGRTLAKLLAERLELDFHDHSLVEQIARDQNLPDHVVEQMDEKTINAANLWVQGVLKQRFFMKSEYKAALNRIITDLATKGNAVFLGRGANLILGRDATLRIRVIASMPHRLKRLRQKTGVGKAETRAFLDETDTQREEFVRKVFRKEPGQPENFDLIFNADRISLEGMVELTLLALLDRESSHQMALKELMAQE
jgi:cytidylate kinase